MSDSPERLSTLKNPPFHICLSQLPRPLLQREDTSSPSQWPYYTAKTSHGFIAMHTSTPAEEVNHTWSNGKPAYNGDYFSVRKQKTLCSPEHVSYEAHGFLPLGSVAAVEEDTKDYFACASDVSTESPDPRTDPESVNPEVVEHFESKSAPRRQFADYIYTSHLPLRELTHPTGSPIGERDIVPEPEEDSDSQRKLEVKLRGGSGEGPCEGDCKTCDVVCARSAFVSDDAVFDRVEEPPRDITKEPNLVSVLDSAIDQMLRTCSAVRRNASQALILNDTPTSMGHEPDHAPKSDDTLQKVQQSTNRSDTSKPETAVLADGVLAQSENTVVSPGYQSHKTSPNAALEGDTPRSSMTPVASPVGYRRPRIFSNPLEPVKGGYDRLFTIMHRTDSRELVALKSGFTVDLVNATTKEIYVRNVPLRMLWHFCGIKAFDRFVPNWNERPEILKIPAEEAEKSGIVRVVRYMRRACKTPSVRPTGELRVPPSLAAGIQTIRACRVFGLEADAERMEDMIIYDWMGRGTWYMTDEHVEMIWDGYHGSLRDTVFGDSIVWFVLTEVQSKSHPLAEEIRWMLDQEEYETLKARVMSEVQRKKWRQEDRSRFLGRCRRERAEETRKAEEDTARKP